MRLWHSFLIDKLPRQQLLGLHRETCALRGLGWDKKHSTIDYIKKYSLFKLYMYHLKVIYEMKRRGYEVDRRWLNFNYRGKKLGFDFVNIKPDLTESWDYPEHDDYYLQECLDNLKSKGIILDYFK